MSDELSITFEEEVVGVFFPDFEVDLRIVQATAMANNGGGVIPIVAMLDSTILTVVDGAFDFTELGPQTVGKLFYVTGSHEGVYKATTPTHFVFQYSMLSEEHLGELLVVNFDTTAG